MVHLDVEDCSEELLRQHSYAIKGAYNRTFPCMEANYPYAIKNQRGASKKPLVGGFGCNELVLYGIRMLAGQILESDLDTT